MSAAYTAIPFEKQSDPQTSRMCGAACLSMVYRSLGKEAAQAEIWPAIAKVNRFGSLASTTHLMASDALSKGLTVVAIQARHPLQVLRRCVDGGIRAILNHRLQPDSPTGHYSVLVDIDDKNVVLHDPFFGPSRCFSHADLLELWRPRFPNSEIVGNILIGIAAESTSALACEFCHTQIPSKFACPRCKTAVSLQPNALLGCIRDGCIARMWNSICCPSCDYLWDFGQGGKSTSDVSGAAAPIPGSPDPQPAVEPLNFEKVFAAMDNFCSHVLSIPGAANHKDLKAQIDFLAGMKDKIKLAQVEEASHFKSHHAQLSEVTQTAKQKEEAHWKKVEEINKPAPPLDGDALGRALLKNLGFK